jgi:nucleoside 2-deoxyribosyltransferase
MLLPQQYAKSIKGKRDFLKKMYRWCLETIDSCEAMVALVEGADADSGTCVEIGYAKAKGKIVIGVRTDFRVSEENGLNLMVAMSCSPLIYRSSLTTTLNRLTDSVAKRLQQELQPL